MAFVSVPKDLTKVKINYSQSYKTTAHLPWYCSGSRASVLFPVKGIDWFE